MRCSSCPTAQTDHTVPSQDAVRAFFDSREYLARNPIIRVRARIVQHFLSDLENKRVLDLGCGDGSISRPLLAAGNRLTLVDFSPAMLDSARAAIDPEAPVEFVEANILEYVPDREYDAVLCVGVLAHVPSVDQVVTVIADALRPGGRCVIQITDDSSALGWLLNRYYRRRSGRSHDKNLMTRAKAMSVCESHGLVMSQSRRYGLLLPGLGALPYAWELRLEMAVAERPRLARASAELLLLLTKQKS